MRRSCLLWQVKGQVDYESGLKLQAEAQQLVAAGVWDGVFILLEHSPVITIGRAGGEDNLLIHAVQNEKIPIVYSGRGGNITCHNPGQLVGYPVLNLRRWQRDVHWYVEVLEEVLIQSLAVLGLRTGRKQKYTGVWYYDEKIAAIGIGVRNWITGHGFALNVNNDLALFQTIVPCGIREFGVTSLEKCGIYTSVQAVANIVIRHFGSLFDCDFYKDEGELIWNGQHGWCGVSRPERVTKE